MKPHSRILNLAAVPTFKESQLSEKQQATTGDKKSFYEVMFSLTIHKQFLDACHYAFFTFLSHPFILPLQFYPIHSPMKGY